MSSATPAAGATRADRGTAGIADPAPGWHARPPEDVLRALDADVRGLSAAQARQRLAEPRPQPPAADEPARRPGRCSRARSTAR